MPEFKLTDRNVWEKKGWNAAIEDVIKKFEMHLTGEMKDQLRGLKK